MVEHEAYSSKPIEASSTPILETGTVSPEDSMASPLPTALVRIKPEQDALVQAFYDQALGLRDYAEKLVITTADDLRPATNDLSVIAKLKKALEEKRKEYVKPLQEHVQEINDAFKNLVEPILAADSITRQKILGYRQEQERIRQEQERINRLRMEAARAEMELKGELTESVELVETQPEQPNHYRTDTGTLATMKVRKWEEVDFAQVPDEYKMIDAAKVGRVVRAGISSIPGIRIWEEETLRVTAK